MIIPVNNHKALVAESRRSEGVDANMGGEDGVLIYTVDTSIGHMQGTQKVHLPDGRDPGPFSYGVWSDALLAVGARPTVEGTTIEVLQTGDYDRIRFSKAALAETTATTTTITTTTFPPATETAGIQDGTFATCRSFLTPNDAQT